MTIMKLFAILCLFGLLSYAKSAEKEENLEEVFSEPSRNATKDSHILIDRDYEFTNNYTTKITIDYVTIKKEITKEKNVKIVYSTKNQATKNYSTHNKEVNLCDDAAKDLDGRIRDYVLKNLGIKEKKCPIAVTKKPAIVTHSDKLKMKLDFDEKATNVQLIVKLMDPDNKIPLFLDVYGTASSEADKGDGSKEKEEKEKEGKKEEKPAS